MKHETCTLPDPTYPDWDESSTAYFREAVNKFTDPHTNVPDALAFKNIVPAMQTTYRESNKIHTTSID